MSAHKLESQPADCWDWITPDDVIRHALAAFYAARREISTSDGPWFDAGTCTGWSSRGDFRDTLGGLFAQRINLQAYEQGLRRPPCSLPRDLPLPLVWDGQVLSANDLAAIEYEELGGKTPSMVPPELGGPPGCRGGAPAGMGHGCPALVAAERPSAAEAAPIEANGHEHNPPDDRLFFADNRKKLRVGETHVKVNHAGEVQP